ncbi:carph-isopro domain-containing protein, partial [Acidisphaera rubrifaciens]|uniref:carph-isopro domain-containing protein n=1 Tax=Acidisphaera rubrifaciens TaxID=50715 RepID=UPI0006624A35
MRLSVDQIIDRLGGAEAAAKLAGVGTEAVRKWRQAQAIPPRHWSAIVAAGDLRYEDLSDGREAAEGGPP